MSVDVEKIVRENIDRTFHMSLATVSGNAPWVSEVHFGYDEGLNLYWRSLKTRRHSQEISANPNVAGNIIDKHGLKDYPLGLYFEGVATLLEAGAEQNLANECIKKRLQTTDKDYIAEAADGGHQFYKISVKNWYIFGKFDGEHGEKYKLEWNENANN